MSVYAIADLHLSFSVNKPMDVFKGWENYTDRLKQNWQRLITPEDTVVIAGDVSWAMNLSQIYEDFKFIDGLNGKKIILKGNHDYWWTTKAKMDKYISDNGFETISILHNNYFVADGVAICGSRGWFYDAEDDADKIILNREVGRIRLSVEPAINSGYTPVVFLHYPPIYNNIECKEIIDVLREYKIKKCFYGHIHGGNAAKRAFIGERYGIKFNLIACDRLGFMPLAIK